MMLLTDVSIAAAAALPLALPAMMVLRMSTFAVESAYRPPSDVDALFNAIVELEMVRPTFWPA